MEVAEAMKVAVPKAMIVVVLLTVAAVVAEATVKAPVTVARAAAMRVDTRQSARLITHS